MDKQDTQTKKETRQGWQIINGEETYVFPDGETMTRSEEQYLWNLMNSYEDD